MTAAWCVYTNDFVAPEAMNVDHVIPVSLGGHDRFRVRASVRGNSLVNRIVDEPFGRHPFVANMRRLRGLTDRRGRAPVVRWPSDVGGAPATINWSTPQIERETFRSRSHYHLNTRTPLVGGSFMTTVHFDENQILSFGARLALGAGYFLFGDTFRRHGLHSELRELMTSDRAAELREFRMLNAAHRRPFWARSWPQSATEIDPLWDHLCRSSPGHVVLTEHTTSGIVMAIGMFGGFFQWSFLVSNHPAEFPIGGPFELGAYIQIEQNPQTFLQTDLRSRVELVELSLGPRIE